MTTTCPEDQAAELRRQIGDLAWVDCEPEGVFSNDPESLGNLVRVELPGGRGDDVEAVWLDSRGPEPLLVQFARQLLGRCAHAA